MSNRILPVSNLRKEPIVWLLLGRAWRLATADTTTAPAIRARSRLTTRLRTELGDAIAEQGRVVSESAAHYGVDWSIVHAAFVEHVKAPLAAPLPPVKVLGIDETRRGKPVWAKQPRGDAAPG
jgi:hypothetical protein